MFNYPRSGARQKYVRDWNPG